MRLAAIRAGGNHFLKKPIDESRLIHLLQAELRVGPEQPYRVLLVDDDEDLLALYQPILEKAGYRVFTATDAESAMDLAHRERPELALVDVSMPRCNGIELGQLIRQHEQLADMALLFMSAYHDTDVELACARLADDEFIHKPVEWWRLLMVVRSRVERARRLRSQQLEQSQIKQFAALNPLTALPTRNAFQKALDARIRSSEQEQMLAVLKIDIRDFHEVNDLYGQFAGDETLQRIAWDISRTVANQDMLAHEGGDEYLLMMPALEERQEAFALAQSIQAVIANPARNDSEPTPLTADIGIAVWPQDGTMADELLQCADTALFEARESHSPAIRYFSPEIQVEQQTRFALVKEIRQALADECFVAAYQPIFSVVNGRLLGFEALARWQHPQKGLLGPGSFIGAMEQQGLISGLTTQMLNGAIKQLAAWHNHGSELFVSVNLSAHDLQDSDLSTNIANLLKRYNIEASRLILEITESVLLEDWPQAFSALTYLESLGVQVALDDFGTGYSSLNYLNRIRATKLKVDRGFIQSWSKNGDERLMRGIIQLGHSLGMDIVAEGVEDRNELAMLSGLKCGSYQGFLASKPLLKEEVVKQGWFLEKCFNGLS